MIEARAGLPAGWEWRTIRDVTVDVANVDPRRHPESTFSYVDIASIDNERFVVTEAKTLSGRDAPSRARRPLRPGDVVFSNVRTYLRKIARINGLPDPAIASTGFTVLRPDDEILTDYLFRYVTSDNFIDLITPHQIGTQYPATSDRVVRAQPIPVPPLPEQKRICRHLDEIDRRCTAIVGRLSIASGSVERLRGAVLAAACSGRLTADWREDQPHKDADSLTSETSPVKTDLQVPSTWAQATLEEISTRITSGPRDWSRYYGNGSSTFVMAQNVRRGRLDWTFRQTVDPPSCDPSRRRCQIELGDLLVTIVGANTGDLAPVLEHRPEHFVCQSVALIRPRHAGLAPFLGYWFNSPAHGRGYFDECIYGAGRPHLSFEQLKRAPVALPPPEEQREIVRRVTEVLSRADALDAAIAAAAVALDRAKRSASAKAFRGELGGVEVDRVC